ncbi:MAG: single-stranded-DNA-specific exonuclease RecJ [Betaproteobacteria bacterium]|nr:MAG: single-stranded-DNA-specific exonuclease RecJ [Betaproteobacteria bacterium]
MSKIIVRNYTLQALDSLIRHGIHPVLARIYAARGITEPGQITKDLSQLIPFKRLKNISIMAALLADAIAAKKRLLIVADYDSDGATACAVGIRALRKFGATVDYLVPNRFEYGYGLTPEIVRLAAAVTTGKQPDIFITVDNGIASVEGVAEANRLGIQVLITDHHLPGDELPDAAAIVNPNQPGCDFPSKNIAGVGVMFYLMLALRAELRGRGAFVSKKEPNLINLLDLVALGTVADVVKLDDNNRILVQQGLYRIRNGHSCAGISALLYVVRRDLRQVSTYELGFMLGPRLNAAGRLDDMAIGIECLITDDESYAMQIALQLEALNRQRREIEADMQDSARVALEKVLMVQGSRQNDPIPRSLSLFDPSWHQGVIGILASRIKDKFHRPVIMFAPGNDDEIKGSGRSIPGFHLRDALDVVSKRYPGLLLKFGGHAAAAGLTVRTNDFGKFRDAFEQTAQAQLTPADLMHIIETDGDLNESEMNLELAQLLTEQAWGQGFPYPSFNARFSVENQRVVGEKHLKLKLRKHVSSNRKQKLGRLYDAMLFFHHDSLPETIDAVYRLQINEYSGNTTLQLTLDYWAPV